MNNNILKIHTNNKVEILPMPQGDISEVNHQLRALIGKNCSIYECVRPKRLYNFLGAKVKATSIPGQAVSMLVDENFLFQDLPLNLVGSFLYETDRHGSPILGDILIVGERWTSDGIEFCGIDEEELQRLFAQITKIFKEA